MNYPKRLVHLPALAVLLAIAGCEPRTVTFLANNEITATANITGIRHTNQGDMVTAKLSIEGTRRKLVSADLECFWLHVGTRTSKTLTTTDLRETSLEVRNPTQSPSCFEFSG